MTTAPPSYTKKDFMSDQIIRWCPGCGDYSILSQVQAVFAQLGLPRESFAVVSGIGCSSRFPYYMSTYGFHTIHGRAAAVASGLKASRPDLAVWVISGDGDALSIGGNHTAHLLRRNVDVKLLVFNNRIYGLTKGQYSPTSPEGKRTKSSPMGSIDHPFNPLSFALGSGATCVIRSVDVFPTHLRDTLLAAAGHRGTVFMEILQNCNIFNDGAFESFTAREVRDDRVLFLEAGRPMVWGASTRWGLVQSGFGLEKVELANGITEAECVPHDPANLALSHAIAALDPEAGMPVPVGVIHQVSRSTYDDDFTTQISEARKKLGAGDLAALLEGSETWRV
jgi:2-oxoglutarate ferredoxin oxidoreductase subunit beta